VLAHKFSQKIHLGRADNNYSVAFEDVSMSMTKSAFLQAQEHSSATPNSRCRARCQSVGIVIPASNHERTIATCIAGLFAAQYHMGWRNGLWIVVVADSCTDHTSHRAREALGAFGAVLEVNVHSLRACHRIGEIAVLRHFETTPRHALLLTSADAATPVPRDWLRERATSATLLPPFRPTRLLDRAAPVPQIDVA
jgi:hypothetical protein